MSVDDKNLLLGSGAANDAAADGGGITLESGDGNKTINWVDSTDSWTFSENVDLAASKTYKINNVDVLTSTTLGSGVVNSSLTSVGTLTGLNVSGNLDVDGTSELDNVNVTGITTLSGTFVNGNLILAEKIVHSGDTDTQIKFPTNDEIDFRTAGSSKLYINSTGNVGVGSDSPSEKLDVAGTTKTQQLNVSGVSTFQNHVHLGDDDELRFGDSNDLKIFHNGSHSVIRDEGTGVLFLQGDAEVRITDVGGNEIYGQFNKNGSVDLYYDNFKKFETTGYGVTVSGDLNVSGNASVVGILTVGSSSITIDGSSDELKVGTGVTITHSNGIFVGETRVHSGGITAHDINTTGIITASQFSGTLVGSSQTNITSVGTLDSLTVSGVINSNTDVRINGTGVLQSASDEAIALAIALG